MSNRTIFRRIFIPVALTVISLLLSILLTFNFFVETHFDNVAGHNLYQTHQLFLSEIEQHADQMSGFIDVIKTNRSIQSSQSKLDTLRDNAVGHAGSESMFRLSQPFYKEISSKHGVQYLAFYNRAKQFIAGIKDTTRVLKGEIHGLFDKSEKSNAVVHGLVFDSEGLLSLRVVYPWYIDKRHVGFIEIGKRFSDVIGVLKQVFEVETSIGARPAVSVGTQIDSVVFDQLWVRYTAMNKQNGIGEVSQEVYRSFLQVMPLDTVRPTYNLIYSDSTVFYIGYVEYQQEGVAGVPLCYYKEVTQYVDQAKQFTLLLTLIVVAVCAVIFLIFWLYIRSIERWLSTSHEGLEKERVNSDIANRAKTKFLTNMSHEIRTPLNAIIGFSQILLKRSHSKVLSSEDYQFIENINASGKNLNLLINDVLDLSKIEAGKAIVVERDFLVKEFISNLVSIYKPQAYKNRIEFVSYYDPELPLSIKSDKGKINQILINLIGNAIKYTPDGSKIEFSILKESDSAIAIKVVNEGVEIPIEKQKIIFDPFERINRDMHQNVKGTGLGLAITKNLVELLGGAIFLTSEQQRTEFSVIIPFKETVVGEVDSEISEIEKVFIEDATIVIVEDNEMNVSIMKNFFEDYNYKILIANDGESGLELIKAEKPDLVLMDVQLPKMSGLEVVKAVREDEAFGDIPIIAMSANAFIEHKEAAEAAGMNDYITKPIDFDELIVVLEKFLYESRDLAS